jgi:hypothetical protein
MSKQKNYWLLILGATIVILACSSIQIDLSGNTPAPAVDLTLSASTTAPLVTTVPNQPMHELMGYWQDGLKVFTIAWQNDQYVVTALNVAGGTGSQILNQSWNGSSLTWTYKSYSSADPNTFTTQSVSGDRLTVLWSDKDGTTGRVILRRVPSPTPAYESLPFNDDFSDPGTGWDILENEYGSLKYENGYYSVRSIIKEEGQSSYAFRFFNDPVITVDATSVSGPSNNNYGFFIGCNTQINGDGYWFDVDVSGYYVVGITTDGKYKSLFTGDDRRASNAIHTGKSTNHVIVTCAGGQLILEVNDKELFRGSDYTFTEGDINLGAISYEDAPAEIHFDNLSVTAP